MNRQPSATSRRTLDRGTGPEDLILVQAALRGERGAVDGVMQRMSCVVRFTYRLNRTLGYQLATESLEDVVQQVYVSIWPRLADYAGTAALETWVYGFCRNCLRSEFRRRTAKVWLAPTDELVDGTGEGPDPEEQAERLEGLDLLHDELGKLEDVDREIVELRHFQEWSFEQIARRKGLPPSTIKDRCYRAIDKIRIRMKRRYGRA